MLNIRIRNNQQASRYRLKAKNIPEMYDHNLPMRSVVRSPRGPAYEHSLPVPKVREVRKRGLPIRVIKGRSAWLNNVNGHESLRVRGRVNGMVDESGDSTASMS